MRYLSGVEILAIHERVLEETHGLQGVRDEHLLKSLAERPRASFGGVEQFNTFDKAAALLESIAIYHVFLDGNKRTAIAVATIFLNINGYAIELAVEEAEILMLAAAQKQKSIQEISSWLEARSRTV